MKTRRIILLFVLPVFLFSSHRQTILGAKFQTETKQILKEAQTTDDDEIVEAIHEASEMANDITDDLIPIHCFNADSTYVNWLLPESSSLLTNNENFVYYMNRFYRQESKISGYLHEYADKYYAVDNLNKVYQSRSYSEIPRLTYYEDFVIDKGMHDFIKERNDNAFIYDFGYPELKEILNPEYLNVYSVYDEVLQDRQEENEIAPLLLGDSAVISLTTALFNVGLSKMAVETIKGAFLTLRAAIRFWLPFAARVALCVAAIAGIAITLIVYWAQLACIIYAIVDIFLSVAGRFSDCIREAFTSVIDRAEASSGTENIDVDGKRILMHKLITTAYAKTLESYGDKVYHHAVINETMEYVLISPKSLTKNEAVKILQKFTIGKENYYNTYTFQRRRAREAMSVAFPQNPPYSEINTTGHGWFLPHYHPSNFGKHKPKPHSFYGLPVRIDND